MSKVFDVEVYLSKLEKKDGRLPNKGREVKITFTCLSCDFIRSVHPSILSKKKKILCPNCKGEMQREIY